jgi:hypothetical protein
VLMREKRAAVAPAVRRAGEDQAELDMSFRGGAQSICLLTLFQPAAPDKGLACLDRGFPIT